MLRTTHFKFGTWQ